MNLPPTGAMVRHNDHDDRPAIIANPNKEPQSFKAPLASR